MSQIPDSNDSPDRNLSEGECLHTLDEFLEWFAATIRSTEIVTPEASVHALLKHDALRIFQFTLAFDVLTGPGASPTADIERCKSLRELYLYYLYVMSRPLE